MLPMLDGGKYCGDKSSRERGTVLEEGTILNSVVLPKEVAET